MNEQEDQQYQQIIGCFWRNKDNVWEGFFLQDAKSGKFELIKSENVALIISSPDAEQGIISI